MKFTEYCQKHNIKLLPDDIVFIRRILAKYIPKTQHKAVMKQYCEIYTKVRDEEKESLGGFIRAQNAGRRAANLFLLEKSGNSC